MRVDMRAIVGITGVLMVGASSIALAIFLLIVAFRWFGWFAIVVIPLLPVGILAFPIVYWIAEGSFPYLYFGLLFTGLLGWVLARLYLKTVVGNQE